MTASTGRGVRQEVLDAAIDLLDAGVEPDRDLLLERFPGCERQVDEALRGIEKYYEFARGDRERRAASRDEGLAVGARLGDYVIVDRLGAGGMGIVYRARQRSLGGREVALKVLRASLVDEEDEHFLERFKREAALASRVHDDHVAEVYDYGEHGGQAYFTMQLVEGRPLSEVIAELASRQRQGWSEHLRTDFVRQVVRLVRDLASGLEAIHTAGLLHRDVTPANVILEGAGEDALNALQKKPVLVDFGLVRETESSDLTGPLTRLGTAAFASPEAMLGREQDARTDVFSLGVILHDLLCLTGAGSRGPASSGLRRAHGSNPAVDERLDAIVEMALAHRPELRYEDGGAFREELERYLQRDSIRALPASRWGRARLWARRDPVRAVRVGVTGSLVAGVLLLASWFAGLALPLYGAASRAASFERAGDLIAASGEYRVLREERGLAAWLPGLGDDVERAEEFWKPDGLARACAMLESPLEEEVSRSGLELQRWLLGPDGEEDPARVLRFLVRELEQDVSEARELNAVVTAGQYLLVKHLAYDGERPREEWAERLESELLRRARPEDRGTPMTELRYHAICALSGIGRSGVFRALQPLIGHPDPEGRRLAAAATFRLWLEVGAAAGPRELPLADVTAWCERLWSSARKFDEVLRARAGEPWREREAYTVVQGQFEGQVGKCLRAVAWTLVDFEELEEQPEWVALPEDLREHLEARVELLRASDPGMRPSVSPAGRGMETWGEGGAALCQAEAFNRAWNAGGMLSTRPEQLRKDYLDYDNRWSSLEHSREYPLVRAAGVARVGPATFNFLGRAPVLAGRASSVGGVGVARGYGESDGRAATAEDGFHLEFRADGGSRLHLTCSVPPQAQRATVVLFGVPTSREPLPHRGSARVILSTEDGRVRLQAEVSAAFDEAKPEFLLDANALRGKHELRLVVEASSEVSWYWLQRVVITFDPPEATAEQESESG